MKEGFTSLLKNVFNYFCDINDYSRHARKMHAKPGAVFGASRLDEEQRVIPYSFQWPKRGILLLLEDPAQFFKHGQPGQGFREIAVHP